MTEEEHYRFTRPYDLKLFNALPQADLHVLHLCQHNILLDAVKDYPVHAFNWDARRTDNPSLAEGKILVGGKAVIGGIPQGRTLLKTTPEQLAAEVAGMWVAMGNRGWMLGPGCTFLHEAPLANLQAVRQVAEVVPPKY